MWGRRRSGTTWAKPGLDTLMLATDGKHGVRLRSEDMDGRFAMFAATCRSVEGGTGRMAGSDGCV